jgi:hypothetical protein
LVDTLVPKVPGPGYRPPMVGIPGFTGGELNTVSELYARDYSRYQAALLSKRPLRNPLGMVVASDEGERVMAELFGEARILLLEEEKAEIAQKAIDHWEKHVRPRVRDLGELTEKALDRAILSATPDDDERVLAPWITLALPAGLWALLKLYGFVDGKAEFPRAPA